MSELAFGFGTPFFEQLEFFRQKLKLPTERWDDIKQSAHDRAFVVAGAGKADLLDDLQQVVFSRMADGRGLEAFRQDFRRIVQQHGWTGWTGEGSKAGEAWRTKVIYQTNMATSYAAGRYKQLTDPEFLKLRPYWRYVHSDSVAHPRPHHLQWGRMGLTLRHDHPFWKTHFPPNGWGCQCRVTPVDGPAEGAAIAPPKGWSEINPKTGALVGIDKGFDYAPGANTHRPLQDFIDQKLIKLSAPVGAAMWEALAPVLAMERQLAWWETLDAWIGDEYPRGHTAIVGALDQKILSWLEQSGKPMPGSAEIAITDKLIKGAKQARHEAAQNGLTLEEWRALPNLMDGPANIYYDTRSGHLMFVADGLGPTKAAIEFNPDKPTRKEINLIVSAFRVSDLDIAGAVKGGLWLLVK